MASNDGFDFENMDSMDDMPKSSNKGGGKIKNLAKGIVIGSLKQMEKYSPLVEETRTSASDMAQQLRDQATAVRQQASSAKSYMKGIASDANKIVADMKNAKGIKGRIEAVTGGVNQAKKNLAYAIDPEGAKSFDFDAMFGDDDEVSSGPNVQTVKNEKLGISNHKSSTRDRTVGGRKQTIINKSVNVRTGSGYDDGLMRDVLMHTSAAIISSQAGIFKQTTIINTQHHLEKMAVLNRIADTSIMAQKFNAEMLGPMIKQSNEYFNKMSVQLNDIFNSVGADMNDGEGRFSKGSLFSRMFGGGIGRDGKKNVLDFATASGGVNLGGLYSHFSKKAKEGVDNSGLGMLMGMKDMLPMMLMGGAGGNKNGMQSIGELIGKMATSRFKGKIVGMQDRMSEMIPATMIKGNEAMLKANNPILRGIAELMDLETGTKKGVSLNTQNRKVAFDMVTRRSIVEVIPGYLSKILSAVGGGQEMTFDHKTGNFTTADNMKKRILKEVDMAGVGSMYESRYAIQDTAKVKDKEKFGKDIDVIFKNMMLTGESFDPKNVDVAKYKELTKGVQNAESWNAFLDAWDRLENKDKARLQTNLIRARQSRKTELQKKEIDLMEYGGGTTIGAAMTDSQIEDLQSKRHNLNNLNGKNGGMNMRGSNTYKKFMQENIDIDRQVAQLKQVQSMSDKTGAAQVGKIYDLLLGGIYVFPQRGSPSHIKKIHADRKADAAEKAKQDAFSAKQESEYGKMLEASSIESAENVREERENAKLTGFQRLKKTLTGKAGTSNSSAIRSLLGKMPGGKNIANLMQKAENSGVGKFMGKLGNKIDGGFDKATGFLDSNMATGGLDIPNTLQNTKFGNAATDVISRVKTKEGRKGLTEAVVKRFNTDKAEALQKLKELQTTAPGKLKSEYAKYKKKFVVSSLGMNIGSDRSFSEIEADVMSAIQKASKHGVDKIGVVKNSAMSSVDAVRDGIEGTVKPNVKKKLAKMMPSGLRDKTAAVSLSKDTRSGLQQAAEGGLGLLGTMRLWMQGTMEKFNTSIFGAKEDHASQKKGLLDKAKDNLKQMTNSVMDFLIGGKDGKKPGILLRMAGPVSLVLEKFRHSFMSKLAIPFTQIGKSVARQTQWMMRESIIKLKNTGNSIIDFAKKKYAASQGKEKKGLLGKAIGGIVGGVGGIIGVGTNVTGGATQMLYNRQKKGMQKMLAEGKISQDEYDTWENEYAEKQDKELAKHNSHMKAIEGYQNKINSAMIKDEKLKAEYATHGDEMQKLQAKARGMSSKDRAEENARVKRQQSSNKRKLSKGGKLSQEEEYGALTTDELIYRKRDDMKRKLDKEAKRQEETRAKEELEMTQTRTENSNIIRDTLDKLSGFIIDGKKPPKAKARGKGKSSFGVMSSFGTPAIGKDLTSGLTEGSYADTQEDKTENATLEMAKNIAIIADNTKGEKGPKSKKEEEKEKKDGKVMGLLTKIAGGTMVAAGAATAAIGAAGIGATARKGGQILSKFKNDGVAGGLGALTGIESEGDTDFRADGSRKSGLEKSADNFKAGRFIAHGGLQKSSKLIQVGGKLAGKGLLKLTGSGRIVGTAGKIAGKAVTAVGPKLVMMLEKMLSIKVVQKFIKPSMAKRLASSLGKSVATKLSKSFAGKALKFLGGPIGMAVMAAADFSSGMAEAKRYFKVSKGAEIPLNMRITAGLAKMVNNGLLLGLVPMDWLVDFIYSTLGVGSANDKKKLESMRSEMVERASQLGVDPDKLNEWENKTVGSKVVDVFRSSAKKDLRDAKALGFSNVEEYKTFKSKYDSMNGKGSADSSGAENANKDTRPDDQKAAAASANKALGAPMIGKAASSDAVKLEKKDATVADKTAKKSFGVIGKLAKFTGVGLAATGIGKLLKFLIGKLLSIKAVKKFIDQDKIDKLSSSLSNEIEMKFLKGAAIGSIKALAGGPIGMVVMGAGDFISGMSEAKKYFSVGKSAKITLSMRVTAGVCKMLCKGLLLGIVPINWLVDYVYGILAKDSDKANLSGQQGELAERAKQLGVDPQKLADYENKTFGADLFKSSAKKDERDAKQLGFESVEAYKEWKTKYDAMNGKNVGGNGEVGEKKDNTNKVAKAAVMSRLGTSTVAAQDIKRYGVIDGGLGAARADPKQVPQSAEAMNPTMSSSMQPKMSPSITPITRANMPSCGVLLHPAKTASERSVESLTDPTAEAFKSMSAKMSEFDSKALIENDNRLHGELRNDNAQVISLLTELVTIYKKEYKELKPMREYFKKQGRGSLFQGENPISKLFSNLIGGGSSGGAATGEEGATETVPDAMAKGGT